MLLVPPKSAPLRIFFLAIFSIFLVACGGGDSENTQTALPPGEITAIPSNHITHAYFRDEDGASGKLAGTIFIEATIIDESSNARAESILVYWADAEGQKIGDTWLVADAGHSSNIEIPEGSNIPENAQALLLYPTNKMGPAVQGTLVTFHDFTGNTALSGPGGNELRSWYYGADRPNISIQRTDSQGGNCIFDNGLVSVIDMNNTQDEIWQANSGNGLANQIDEIAFPPYEFLCDENPVNFFREISDDVGVWTYSTLNDTMFYGTIVYDTFLKYLGEPPLTHKLHLRVHYGNLSDTSVYWDGAYANFSDAYPFQYSMAPLDAIAHEIGHGVLNRISELNLFEHEISTDARTLHEAFGDLAGVMAKYEFSGHTDNWIHGEESEGLIRRLDRINTEAGAIDSLLDYDDAGDNFYLRIGMITYPFYLLSNKWGLTTTYRIYLDAARNCWTATTTLTEAAECIKQRAAIAGLAEADVVEAFKTVKIKLFSDGVLSHFGTEKYKLRTVFTDDSRSTSLVTQWLWDFGDGNFSSESNPEHTYAEAGDYVVRLTVSDQSQDTDSFERLVSVTDQYCRIGSIDPDNHITSIQIGGTDINYLATEWDYTQTPIELATPDSTPINIQGDTDATERSTNWKIWIDLNDNGVFGDQSQELLVDSNAAQGQPYSLNTVLDLSALANDGKPRYMRIIGNYVVITPCSSMAGEALDLRVSWFADTAAANK